MYDEKDVLLFDENDSNILRQLKYFHQMDIKKKFSSENLYVKCFYLHHLLDFFKETRVNIYDIDLVFEKFLQQKVKTEFTDNIDNLINFNKEINEIFQLLRENKQELLNDLKGTNF